jgi:hypothetical protein
MDESSYALRSFAPFFFFFSRKHALFETKKKQLPKGAAFIRVGDTEWFSNRFVEGLEVIQSIL